MNANAIGILGGSFDPIHNGHISLAKSALDHLPLADLRVMPAKEPPHKSGYITSESDRLAMLRLVFDDLPNCQIDERELRSTRTSYSVLTLRELRQEVGNEVPLCFIMGWDSIQALATWWHWRELFELVNIAVAYRPGYAGFDSTDVKREIDKRMVSIDALCRQPDGAVAHLPMADAPVASSDIRRALAARNQAENSQAENSQAENKECNESDRREADPIMTDSILKKMVPNVVADYIVQHGLYADY